MALSRKKKIFFGIGGFFLFILLLLIIVPLIFLGRVEQMVKDEANKNLNATLDFRDADLSIIRSFPDFTLSIHDFSLIGKDAFEGDTLASVQTFRISMDFWTVVRGEEYEVKSMEILKPYVNVIVNTEGESNTDIFILQPEEEEEAVEFKISMEKFLLENGRITYTDYSAGKEPEKLLITGINQKASGEYSGDDVKLLIEGGIDKILYNDFPAYTVAMKIDAFYKSDSSKLSLNENTLSLNELDLAWDGWLIFNEDESVDMDISLNSGTETFKDILSLVPSSSLQSLDGMEANGTIDVGGYATGTYADGIVPAFDFHIEVADASLKYPDLPKTITNINFSAGIENPGVDPNLTVISIPAFHLDFGPNPLDLVASLSNFVENPLQTIFDLHALAIVDLSDIGNYVPIDDISMSGIIDLKADANGVAKDVLFKNYDQLTLQATVDATDLDFYYEPIAEQVEIPEMSVLVNAEEARINKLKASIGNSDFEVTGTAHNLMTYYMGLQPLEGDFNLYSGTLNADELILISERLETEEAPAGSEAEAAMTAEAESDFIRIPEMLDLGLDAKVDNLIYDGLTLKNVSTHLDVVDETLVINDMKAELLGGSWIIDGKYITKGMTDKPGFEFSYDIVKFDIAKSFEYINSMDNIAPLAGYMLGVFSSDLTMTGKLNPDLSLDLMSLTGDGRVDVPYATFETLPVLEKAAELTKLVDLDKLALSNAWTVLSFSDGRVYVDPSEIKWKDYTLNIQGSNGFDYSMDYFMQIDVPTTKLGQAKSVAEGLLAKNPIPNFNLSMPEVVSFNIEIGGTFTEPELKLLPMTLGGDQTIKDQIKESLKNQAEAAKDSVITDLKDIGDDTKNQLEDAGKKAVDDLLKGGTDSLKLGGDLKGVGDSLKDKLKNNGLGGFKWPK